MSELVDELRNHIAMLPEHVRSRASGKMLIRCRDELTKQSERVRELEALLRRLERQRYSDDPNDWYCPVCDCSGGHTEICDLHRLLKGTDQ